MTPKELLAAAEKVKRIVEAAEKQPDESLIDIMQILREMPNVMPSPLIHEPMPPQTTMCPNFPNPCYCTGACLRLGLGGDFKKPPGAVYC